MSQCRMASMSALDTPAEQEGHRTCHYRRRDSSLTAGSWTDANGDIEEPAGADSSTVAGLTSRGWSAWQVSPERPA
jgi:hypothetical protein